MKLSHNIAIVGMGKFGTAIGSILDRSNRYKIHFITNDNDVANEFNESKSNPRCFNDYIFKNSFASSNFSQIEKCGIIFLTTSSDRIIETVQRIRKFTTKRKKIILCSKGLPLSNFNFYTDFIKKEISKSTVFVLSGPNFADEMLNNEKTITTIAGKGVVSVKFISFLFRGTNLKIESSSDIYGVQILGAIKNVMAIAIGILEGQNCGRNVTIRGIMYFVGEIQRLLRCYKGKNRTIYSCAGIGDIMLTCFDEKSRNKSFGLAIGKGMSIDDAIKTFKLVEGYSALKAIQKLSAAVRRIDKKPLICIDTLYDILYENRNPKELLDVI